MSSDKATKLARRLIGTLLFILIAAKIIGWI